MTIATLAILASQIATRELAVPRITTPPVIDGRLDDAVWRQAAVVDHWVQVRPADNGTPYGTTEAWLAYDSEALYVAIHARDDPSKVRYVSTERDAVAGEAQDWVAISLDPSNHRARAYTIAVNPIGIEADWMELEGSGFSDWNGIFTAAGRLTEDGYAVEIAIPFRSFRFPKTIEQRWAVSLTRSYGRDGSVDSPWPISRDQPCGLCQMATLRGITGIRTAGRVELNPALVGHANASRPDRTQTFDTRTWAELGVNSRVGLAPNVSLDATWNPDFSQIESDAGQLEINNRLALFLAEQRPFFLEGTDVFPTRLSLPGSSRGPGVVNLIHSRRIVDPDAAVKVTGFAGRFNFGMIGALDAAKDYEFDRSVGGLAPHDLDPFSRDVRAVVARGKYRVGVDGYVGVTATDRESGDGYGRAASIDGRFRLGDHITVRLLAAHSDDRAPDVFGEVSRKLAARISDSTALKAALDSLPAGVDSLNGRATRGSAVMVGVDYQGRHWQFGAGGFDITPSFQTALGFTPRPDYALVTAFVSYLYQSTGVIRRVSPRIQVDRAYDHSPGGGIAQYGRLTDRAVVGVVDVDFPAGTNLGVQYERAGFDFGGVSFDDLDRLSLSVSSAALARLGINAGLSVGEDAIYYDEVDGGPPSPDSFLGVKLGLAGQPAPFIRTGLDASASRIWRRTPTDARASKYAESVVGRFRGHVQLSKRMGIRLIVDYRVERFYLRSGAASHGRDGVATDALLSYLIRPGQSVMIGWSTLSAGTPELPLATVARGGVAKVTYTWRW